MAQTMRQLPPKSSGEMNISDITGLPTSHSHANDGGNASIQR